MPNDILQRLCMKLKQQLLVLVTYTWPLWSRESWRSWVSNFSFPPIEPRETREPSKSLRALFARDFFTKAFTTSSFTYKKGTTYNLTHVNMYIHHIWLNPGSFPSISVDVLSTRFLTFRSFKTFLSQWTSAAFYTWGSSLFPRKQSYEGAMLHQLIWKNYKLSHVLNFIS